MTKRSILFALFGGLTAGLTSFTPSNDRIMIGQVILLTLVSLPIFLAGLSSGVRSGLIAALLATSISISLNGESGIVFGLTIALPAAFLVSMAVMPINFWRQPVLLFSKSLRLSKIRTLFGKNADEYVEVPSGSILLLALILMGGMVFVALSMIIFWGESNPEFIISKAITEMIKDTNLADLPKDANLMLESAVLTIARFPSLMVESWLICLAFNGIIAQGLLMRFNYNLRTAPDMGNLGFPIWFSVIGLCLLMISLGAEAGKMQDWLGQNLPQSVAQTITAMTLSNSELFSYSWTPWIGYIARNLLLIQMLGFFFAGMAVMHTLSRKRPYRILVLIVYYALALMVPWVMLATNIIGLIEPWAKLRRRLA